MQSKCRDSVSEERLHVVQGHLHCNVRLFRLIQGKITRNGGRGFPLPFHRLYFLGFSGQKLITNTKKPAGIHY